MQKLALAQIVSKPALISRGTMVKHTINKLSNETGTTLIEFTFVLSVLLAMTFAMIDFGRYVYTANVVRSAAQEGARTGIRGASTEEEVRMTVLDGLLTLDRDQATIDIHEIASGIATQSKLQVDVSYQFRFITPFLEAAAGGPIAVDGSASMLLLPVQPVTP
jgi:Flp pilus assembly protein TadG